MRVRYAPGRQAKTPLGGCSLLPGRDYLVFAIAHFEGRPYLLVRDETGFVSFFDAADFSLESTPIPDGWVVSMNEADAFLVCGLPLVAASLADYEATVLRRSDKVALLSAIEC